MNRFISFCKLAILSIFLSGCMNHTVNLDMQTGLSVNPDVSQKSLPVKVRVYQLSDKTAFEQATFRQLWLQDKQILGGSMLARQSLMMAPNSKQKLELDRNKKAKYLAAIAIFRDPNVGQWRALEKMPTGFWFISGSADIELKQSTIKID